MPTREVCHAADAASLREQGDIMTNFKRHLAALATGIAATALIAGAAFADPAIIYDLGGKL